MQENYSDLLSTRRLVKRLEPKATLQAWLGPKWVRLPWIAWAASFVIMVIISLVGWFVKRYWGQSIFHTGLGWTLDLVSVLYLLAGSAAVLMSIAQTVMTLARPALQLATNLDGDLALEQDLIHELIEVSPVALSQRRKRIDLQIRLLERRLHLSRLSAAALGLLSVIGTLGIQSQVKFDQLLVLNSMPRPLLILSCVFIALVASLAGGIILHFNIPVLYRISHVLQEAEERQRRTWMVTDDGSKTAELTYPLVIARLRNSLSDIGAEVKGHNVHPGNSG